MQGDGHVSLAAPDDGALETEFQIFGGAKADFLKLDPRVAVGALDVARFECT